MPCFSRACQFISSGHHPRRLLHHCGPKHLPRLGTCWLFYLLYKKAALTYSVILSFVQDSVEAAKGEIAMWFPEGIIEWHSIAEPQLYE